MNRRAFMAGIVALAASPRLPAPMMPPRPTWNRMTVTFRGRTYAALVAPYRSPLVVRPVDNKA